MMCDETQFVGSTSLWWNPVKSVDSNGKRIVDQDISPEVRAKLFYGMTKDWKCIKGCKL